MSVIFGSPAAGYIIALALLVIFFLVAFFGGMKDSKAKK